MQRVAVLLVCLAALVSPISMSARHQREARSGRPVAARVARYTLQRTDADACVEVGKAQYHGDAPAGVTSAALTAAIPSGPGVDSAPHPAAIPPGVTCPDVAVEQTVAPPRPAALPTRLAHARISPRAPPA